MQWGIANIYTVTSPVNTVTASPVSCTVSSGEMHTVRTPPGSCTSMGVQRRQMPCKTMAAAAAQAPVPHASVAPLPRSHTLTVTHAGGREPFGGSDTDFILSDGGTFNVLKGESNVTEYGI